MAKSMVSKNPFAPGAGTMPAFFSGRKEQIEAIDLALNRTKSAYKPKKGGWVMGGTIIVLTGPRGIGKTLLLKIAMDMALDKKMQVVDLMESDLSDPFNYLSQILPEGRLEGFLRKHRAKLKSLGWLDAEMQPHPATRLDFLHEAITERIKSGPLLVTLDEAHAIPDDFMRRLYQETKNIMEKKQPLAVIMAGTPSIKRHRKCRRPTFVDRTDLQEFNLLSDAETQDAFVNSFSAVGMKVEPKAFRKLTKWSDNYPYFVQMAGFGTCLCKEDINGTDTITLADVNKGIKQARKYRDSFFAGRVVELRDEGLVKVALQVVTMFKKAKGSIKITTLRSGLEKESSRVGKTALAVVNELLDLGFIYRKASAISPGIPSLFDYMEKRAQ